MIRIAVVDDDQIILEKICDCLSNSFTEEIEIDRFTDSEAFFCISDKSKYNVVFLDIDMPKINGFELAENIKIVNENITVIFVSSYEHLVFQSFKYDPFRFVRKSNLNIDISSAINDYRKKYEESMDYYVFDTSEHHHVIMLSDILFFESMGHDIFVNIDQAKLKIKRDRFKEVNIKSLSEQLGSKGFIRIHRSFLVNYKYIYKINKSDVILKNGKSLLINSRKSNEIKSSYQEFLMRRM